MSLPLGGGRAAKGPAEAGVVQRLQAEGREGSTACAQETEAKGDGQTEPPCSCRGEAGSMADGAAVCACECARVSVCEQAHRRSCF